MKVKIKRLKDSVPLPQYESDGAVGFDLCAAEDLTVKAKSIEMIPTGLVVEVPEKYMLMIASRSSTPHKKGISPPHGLGIIDHDYCGPEDEIKVLVYNFRDQDVEIVAGEKIAQGVFVRVGKAEWLEVEEMERSESRGGFGSTGGYQGEREQAGLKIENNLWVNDEG